MICGLFVRVYHLSMFLYVDVFSISVRKLLLCFLYSYVCLMFLYDCCMMCACVFSVWFDVCYACVCYVYDLCMFVLYAFCVWMFLVFNIFWCHYVLCLYCSFVLMNDLWNLFARLLYDVVCVCVRFLCMPMCCRFFFDFIWWL